MGAPLAIATMSRIAPGVIFPAPSNVVNKLQSLGILRETTGHARDRPRYDSYVNLFSDEPLS